MKKFYLSIVILVVAALGPGTAWAGGGGKPGGVMDVNPGLWIWTIITFLVLLTLLKIFVWRPMLNALDSREKNIREALDSASKSQEETQKALETAQAKISEASNEARTIIANAQEKAENLQKEMVEKTEKECARIKEQAEVQIQQTKEKALQEILEHLGVLSTEIAAKILHKSITPEDHKQIIDESLQNIRKQMEVA